MNKIIEMARAINKAGVQLALFLMVLFLAPGCSKIYYPYVPAAPPVSPYLPTESKLNYINVPPVILPRNELFTRSFSSTQFKIGVLPCKDNTGELRGTNYKTSLADQINTALEDTKRFKIHDIGEFTDIDKIGFSDVTRQGISTDTIRETQDTSLTNVTLRAYYTAIKSNKELVESLKKQCDALLETTITSVTQDQANSKMYHVGIECKIIATNLDKTDTQKDNSDDLTQLYAHSHEIKFYTDQQTKSIKADKDDVNKIALAIKEFFPNPDLQDSVQIVGISEKIIKVNIGKNNNIHTGMVGFVVKPSKATHTNDYRAKFVVTDVFPTAFTARLLIEPGNEQQDRNIISQIQVGEPVRME
jgi:hypothetical protein